MSEEPSAIADKRSVHAQALVQHSSPTNGRSEQYLTFRVARHDFAIRAASLRGILSGRDLEPVAPSPKLTRFFGEYMCGFASIRGRDIPVVDLRARLKLPHGSYGRHPCIIVVEIPTADGARLAGFIADRVTETIFARERDFSHGKLRLGGRLREVLDPETLLAADSSASYARGLEFNP